MIDNKRIYLTTHSFISYTLDFREISYKLWMLLGAAEAKCEYLAGIPLRPEKQAELNQISLKKGIRATTAIEGNTLSEEEVDKVYRGETSQIPLSRRYQAQEITNVLSVYNEIIAEISKGKGCDVSFETLKTDNAKILKDVKVEAHVIPGEIRTYPVLDGLLFVGFLYICNIRWIFMGIYTLHNEDRFSFSL